MILTLKIVFFLSLAGIIHTYVIYPLLIIGIHALKGKRSPALAPLKDPPAIEVIFAAYNEESVIAEKIRSTFSSSYPSEKIFVRVGSDCSTDRTDSIIKELQQEYANLLFQRFDERTGKAGILNTLAAQCTTDYIIFTDANIIFQEDTIAQLIAPLQDPEVGAVGGYIEYRKVFNKGISKQENAYLQLENRLKNAESELFGAAMGLEGGCYIIRTALLPPIPPLFFMEDFFISLSVMEQQYRVLLEEKANCYEDVSISGTEEYKRKVRISIGNFQNLARFKKLIFDRFYPVGFAFISHKVLRWFTPFFLMVLMVCSFFLSQESRLFSLFAGSYLLFISMGLFGILFSQSKRWNWIKYPGHFIYMNLALLRGFFIYLKGVKSNVWQPTPRNQN